MSFDNGSIDPGDLVGQNLIVELRVKTDPNGIYEDANAVARYLPDDKSESRQPQADEASEPAKPQAAEEATAGSIPF